MILKSREDGGTPGFLQAFRAALAMELKEKMGVHQIMQREEELVAMAMKGLRKIYPASIFWQEIQNIAWVLFHFTIRKFILT